MKDSKPLSVDEWRARLARLAAENMAQLLSDPNIALAFVKGELDQETTLSEDVDMDSLVSAVLAVGRERKQLLDRLRTALVNPGQQAEALALARELCNLPNGGNRDPRTPQAVH